MTPTHHLAQINIAELKAPLDDPLITEFREAIDFVNDTGRKSPGFVWLFQAPDGQSSSYLEAVYDNPLIVVNYTLWEDFEALHHFVYHTVHRYFLQNRKKWFRAMGRQHVTLWWVPAGTIPTIGEAKAKLQQLESEGPGPEVFDLSERYDAAGNKL